MCGMLTSLFANSESNGEITSCSVELNEMKSTLSPPVKHFSSMFGSEQELLICPTPGDVKVSDFCSIQQCHSVQFFACYYYSTRQQKKEFQESSSKELQNEILNSFAV